MRDYIELLINILQYLLITGITILGVYFLLGCVIF